MHADDMRLHHAAGRRRQAEVAIFGVGAQALVEIGLVEMADGEILLRPLLGAGLGLYRAPDIGLAVGRLARLGLGRFLGGFLGFFLLAAFLAAF